MQIPVPGLYDGLQTFGYPRARNFEDLDPSSTANKQIGKPSNVPENNYLKNLAADKERLASVAKIKVVVCFLVCTSCHQNGFWYF